MPHNNDIFTQQITTRELKSVLKIGQKHKQSVMIYSHPGASKSEQVHQFAAQILEEAINKENNPEDRKYLESLRGNNVVDIRLALELPENLRGICLPVELENGEHQTVYATPSFWPTDPRWVGVIFFDEITSAAPSMQAACYQMLLDRCIGEIPFPEKSAVVAAGNREGEGVVYKPLPAVCNRVMQVEMKVDAEQWIEDFAFDARISPLIVGFIKQQPGMLYNGDDSSDCPAFASPRSWVMVDPLIKEIEAGTLDRHLGFRLISGWVGEVAGTAFQTFCDIGHKLPSTKDIMEGKNPRLDVEGDISAYFHIGFQCVYTFLDSHRKGNDNASLTTMADNMFKYFMDNFGEERDLLATFIYNLIRTLRKDSENRELIHSISHIDGVSKALLEYSKLKGMVDKL